MVGGNDAPRPGRPMGVRLATWRARRGLGAGELAHRCGLSIEQLADLESGQDWVDRGGLLVRAVAALQVDPNDLTGQPYPPADASQATVTGFAYQARRALDQIMTHPELRPTGTASPATLDELAARVEQAVDATATGDEYALALTLPELITGTAARTADASASDRNRTRQLHGQGLLLAAGLLRRLGYRDLAWMLVHEAERTEQRVGTRVDIVVEQVRLLLAGGRPEEALAWANRAARTAPRDRSREDDAEHDQDAETHLVTLVALAHARAGRPGTAARTLDAAEHRTRAATALAAIASTRIETAVESGATNHVPGLLHAADLAALPSAARADLLVTAAGASARRGAPGDAATQLADADRLAPLRLRLNPFARDLLAVLPTRTDDPGTVRILRTLADRAGLSAR